jgi:hypothetical protein
LCNFFPHFLHSIFWEKWFFQLCTKLPSFVQKPQGILGVKDCIFWISYLFLFLLAILKFWIKELNLIVDPEKILLDEEGWFIEKHLDTTFGLLCKVILKYVGFQEHVACLDKAKHAILPY